MTTSPLHLRDGHLFLEADGAWWLLDTGAPESFGPGLELAGETFSLPAGTLGLDPPGLSRLVGVDCAGLLGADVLGRFDVVLDVPAGTITLSTGTLEHAGREIPLRAFMGIPIVPVRIAGRDYAMFLDTGAQFSYFEDESIATFPSAGTATDFYPGVGEFEVDTHAVEVTLGGIPFTLRCGNLPELLAAALMVSGVQGIVGNEVLRDRPAGYFPRRRLLVL